MKDTLLSNYTRISLLKFAIPTTIMMLINAVYMIVDGMFIARFINHTALSVMNILYPVIGVVMAIGMLFASGGNAIVSRTFGEKKPQLAREYFSLLVLTVMILGLLFTGVTQIFFDNVLQLLGAQSSETLQAYTTAYARTMFNFLPAMMLQMLFLTFFVTAGNPNLGLVAAIGGGVTNIGLDYLFIVQWHMGLSGAALASGIGFSVPVVIGLLYFCFRNHKALYFTRIRGHFTMLREATVNGLSEMVMSLSAAITTLAFNYLMLYHAGMVGVAALTAFFYVFDTAIALFRGYTLGVSPLIGFNYGSRNTARIRLLFRYSFETILILSVLLTLIAGLFPSQLVGIITGQSGSEVHVLAAQGLQIGSLAYLFLGANFFASGLFTALSNGKISGLIALSNTFVFLLLSLAILPYFWGVTGIWLSLVVAELLGLLVSLYFIVKYRPTYQYYGTTKGTT
jgi:putative MATE family efflux protein